MQIRLSDPLSEVLEEEFIKSAGSTYKDEFKLNEDQLLEDYNYKIVSLKHPVNSNFTKGDKLIQVLSLVNNGKIDWPEDSALYLVSKTPGLTVLEHIPVGQLKS